mgnify:CR=1 FL=1
MFTVVYPKDSAKKHGHLSRIGELWTLLGKGTMFLGEGFGVLCL